MSTIVLTGGGTAGHVIPHLAILPYLKNDFDTIIYIGSKNGMEKSIIEKTGIPYYGVNSSKFVRSLTLKNCTIPFKVISGTIEAGKILDQIKPDIIFSKGGYVSIPVILAGKKRRIPIISHESDYSVGLANKIASKYSKTVLTSFSDTAKTLKNGKYVGSPIRSELFSVKKDYALKFFNLDGKKPVILITGGSLGAKKINDITSASLDTLLENFDVIHVCGKGNKSNVNKKGYFQVEFLDNMEYAFSACDIAVSRSGSNTSFELLSLKKPCLFIPLPKNISRGDQILNAEYFYKKGLCQILYQENLSKQSFISNINSLYMGRKIFIENLTNNPVPDASREISRIIADSVKH